MLATGIAQRSKRRPVGRASFVLLGLSFFFASAVFIAAIAAFIWPGESYPAVDRSLVGHVDDFPPGTVTHLRHWDIGGYLVRLPSGEFLAFDQHEPVNGCSAPWHPREQVFRDPCHGYAYDIEGHASANNAVQLRMTQFEVRINRSGELHVVVPRDAQ